MPIKKLDVEIAMFPGDYRNRKEIEDRIEISEKLYGIKYNRS